MPGIWRSSAMSSRSMPRKSASFSKAVTQKVMMF
jgi:hypothetical protein